MSFRSGREKRDRGNISDIMTSSVPESGSRAAECFQTEEGSDNTQDEK